MTRSVPVIVLALLCAGLILWSFFGVTFQSAEKMPAYNALAALTEGKTDLSTYRQGLIYRINGLSYDLLVLEDTLQKDLTGSQRQLLSRFPQACRSFLNHPSLHNARKFTDQTESLSGILEKHASVAQGLGLSNPNYQKLFRYGPLAVTVAYVLIALWLGLCLLFILLGCLLKKPGFIMTAVIMHTLYCLCLWGFLWAGLTLWLHLGLFYCARQGKKLCGAVDFQKEL